MSSPENADIQTALSALTNFIQMLKCNEWLSRISKEEMKSCLHSAKCIEKLLETLDNSESLENFISLLPNAHDLKMEQLRNACDVVLEMVLSAPGVALPCVRVCIDEYFQLCGSDRFECVLSTVLFQSEIYRVLLDYLASSDDDIEHSGYILQSQILPRLWKTESDANKLRDLLCSWLESDESGRNMTVAMLVLHNEDGDSYISRSLAFALVNILQERSNQAVLFWKVLLKLPQAIRSLEQSSELMDSVLEFLKNSGQWLEATATFTWVSREKGPCKVLGFEELVSALKCLLETKSSVSKKTEHFLVERKNSVGCTLWDDIEGALKA